jgi:hypothetical protein
VIAAGATCSGGSASVRRGRASARDGPDRLGIELPYVGNGSRVATGRGVTRTIAGCTRVVRTCLTARRSAARAKPRLIAIRREAPRDRYPLPDELPEITSSFGLRSV